VVQEVVGEQFVEELEVAAALHLLGVASHDGLCGFAYIAAAHGGTFRKEVVDVLSDD
jgi:hypothetical protein